MDVDLVGTMFLMIGAKEKTVVVTFK
jgi:hypothetical protein